MSQTSQLCLAAIAIKCCVALYIAECDYRGSFEKRANLLAKILCAEMYATMLSKYNKKGPSAIHYPR